MSGCRQFGAALQGVVLFKSRDHYPVAGASYGSLALASAMTTPLREVRPVERFPARLFTRLRDIEISTDLAENVGSAAWFRGLGVLIGLSLTAIALAPDIAPIRERSPIALRDAEFDEARAQMIMPLALGSDTGRRMAATDAVMPLRASPERPRIELTATLGRGDSFARLLQRAGVSQGEAAQVTSLVSSVTNLGDIAPGTRVDVVLGRRTSKTAPRPLELIDFRARLDLALTVSRVGGELRLARKAIAVDATPLRIRGTVGDSLYRSARAAGAPVEAVQDFLRTLNARLPVSQIRPSDEFDIIIGYRRAETGEVEVGKLLFAGIDRDGAPKVQMLRWNIAGRNEFFEASGIGESRGQLSRPVNGPMASPFGMRRHPILRYLRMHNGLDFKASYGAPIFAATDGVVTYAGRKGGFGNYVKLQHGGGIATGYAHMSRIAVNSGGRVRRGQIIGYVGSTGLSTGPHLHYELYRNGVPVNPSSVQFTQRAQLSGDELSRFKRELARLKAVRPGAALTSFAKTAQSDAPREIDLLTRPDRG